MNPKEADIAEWIDCNKGHPFSFLVTGEAGSGKSSLINFIVNEKIAEAKEDPLSITTEVNEYKTTVKVSGEELPILAVDTPGLNDTEKNPKEIFKEVISKIDKPHVIFYCMNIKNRFRDSDINLLLAIIESFGKEIWQRVVFVMTHADQVESGPFALLERFKTAVVAALLTAGVDKTVANQEAVRFCLSAKDDRRAPFIPSDLEGGENERQAYDWRVHLLSTAIDAAPPGVTGMLLKLHEHKLREWYEKHGHQVAAAVTIVSFATALLCGAAAIAVPITAPLMVPAAVVTLQDSVGAAAVVGLLSSVTSTPLTLVLKKKHEQYLTEMKRRQTFQELVEKKLK